MAIGGGLAVGGEQGLVQRTAAGAATAPRRTVLGRRLEMAAQLLDKLRRAAEPVAPERGELAQQSVLVQHAQHLQCKGGGAGGDASLMHFLMFHLKNHSFFLKLHFYRGKIARVFVLLVVDNSMFSKNT